MEPHTEAHPAALLVQLLVAVGNVIGRTAHFGVSGTPHYLNEFVCIVGASARGAKGDSLAAVRQFLETVAPDWSRDCQAAGLTSGVGVLHRIRDARIRPDDRPDPGVPDKRLLVTETEFSATLQAMRREGNDLSAVLRQLWDGQRISSLSKGDPIACTSPHVSIIAHVTPDELRACLKRLDLVNGFGNRFLWLYVERTKSLPRGGKPDPQQQHALGTRFKNVLAFVQGVGEIDFDDAGGAWWDAYYDRWEETHPLLSRERPHLRRLACLYAVLDHSSRLGEPHLRAAEALCRYAADSLPLIFPQNARREAAPSLAEKIEARLKQTPEGMTRTDINRAFSNHLSKEALDQALAQLQTEGRAHERDMRWHAGPATTA
jgi:hypothetical protein